MIDPVTATYALGTLGMLVGVVIAVRLLSIGGDDGRFGSLLAIPGFAALMYAAMAIGVGSVSVAGHAVPIPRYVDWIVTTPLLVGYAAYVAGMDVEWILGIGAADALMIGLGYAAVVADPPLRWGAFAASAVLHLALLGVLYGVMPSHIADQPSERRRLAVVLRNHVGLLWVVYPVVWVFGPGLQLVSAAGISVMITYMDVIAKVPYVYFVYKGRGAFDAGPSPTRESGGEPAVAGAD